MSLVNGIYKNLQQRAHQPSVNEDNEGYFSFPRSLLREERKIDNRIYYIVCSVLIALAGLFLIHSIVFNRDAGRVIYPPLKMEKPSQWYFSSPTLTHISGLSLSVQSEVTELSVYLSQFTPYVINYNQKKGVMYIAFDEAMTAGKQANLNFDSSVLESAQFKYIAKNRPQLELHMMPNAEIEYVNVIDQNQKTILLIGLKSNAGEIKSSPSIKTPSADNDTTAFYNQALLHIQKGEEDKGIERLYYLLNNDPHYELARKALAALYLNKKNHETALELISEGLDLNPASRDLILMNAQALIESKKNRQAISFLLEHQKIIKKDSEYYTLLAEAYSNVGKWNESSEIYRMLSQKNPDNGYYWFLLGESYLKQNKNDLSKRAFQQALNSDDLDDRIRHFLVDEVG